MTCLKVLVSGDKEVGQPRVIR